METNISLIVTIGSFIIFAVSLGFLMIKKDLLMIFINLSIAESSLFLFFIGSHFKQNLQAPIIQNSSQNFGPSLMVDPVPQAMILTTIVITIAILALAMSFVIKYKELSNNTTIDKLD